MNFIRGGRERSKYRRCLSVHGGGGGAKVVLCGWRNDSDTNSQGTRLGDDGEDVGWRRVSTASFDV